MARLLTILAVVREGDLIAAMMRVVLTIALAVASLLCTSCGLLGSMGQALSRTLSSVGRMATG